MKTVKEMMHKLSLEHGAWLLTDTKYPGRVEVVVHPRDWSLVQWILLKEYQELCKVSELGGFEVKDTNYAMWVFPSLLDEILIESGSENATIEQRASGIKFIGEQK